MKKHKTALLNKVKAKKMPKLRARVGKQLYLNQFYFEVFSKLLAPESNPSEYFDDTMHDVLEAEGKLEEAMELWRAAELANKQANEKKKKK